MWCWRCGTHGNGAATTGELCHRNEGTGGYWYLGTLLSSPLLASPSGHHDMILGWAWIHTHLEGRAAHGTHGGFRERSERY